MQARNDIFVLHFTLAVDVPTQLQINPPDIIGLFMQQCRLAAIKGRVKPEPAFGREISLHNYIGNQEIILEHTALKIQPQHPARGRVGTVTGDQPIGLDHIGAIRRCHLKRHMIVVLPHGIDLVHTAQLDRFSLGLQPPQTVHHVFF